MSAKTGADKRTIRRLPLSLPVKVRVKAETEMTSETVDVSARGVFFYLESAPDEGSEVEFTLMLPADITLTEAMRIHCSGRVIRVDRAGDDRFGIAAAIDKYDLSADS